MLTTLSVIGIISTIIDYSLPIINQNFFDPSKWLDSKQFKHLLKLLLNVNRSPSDESQFESICQELETCYATIKKACGDWQQTKVSSPKVYYGIILVTLLALSWIGNVVHNLFLTYLLVIFLVMFPGLKQRGLVDKYVSLVMSYVSKPKKN